MAELRNQIYPAITSARERLESMMMKNFYFFLMIFSKISSN